MRTLLSIAILCFSCLAAQADHFKVGFAKQNITPSRATPMWGYGDRHNALSTGVFDKLWAKAVVIDIGRTRQRQRHV
jgi:hypothetical protein